MKLLSQELKKEMEKCKERARRAGLQFADNTLEYVVTNRDILELEPKYFIPTLYDYWVQDVEVYRNKWVYEARPHNPYEITVNTKPAISYYNQDNPDWLNVVIFYHVLGHIDMNQNNIYFRRTWDDDFAGQALADKRLIGKIRQGLGAEKRWVDYVIEFALSVDNLVGYYAELEEADRAENPEFFGEISEELDFYFGEFLKKRYDEKIIDMKFYYDEISRYNRCQNESDFFQDPLFRSRFPEFREVFRRRKEKKDKEGPKPKDILQYLLEHSEFINKEKNKWMKDVINVVRKTSLILIQPMIRTKIIHEGWASLWHDRLYRTDERIRGHGTDFALLDSGVAIDLRMGLNPYALGRQLLEFIEDLARKGKLSREYRMIRDIELRKRFDKKMGDDYAKEVLFWVRRHFDDRQLINFLSDEDLQNFMEKYDKFVVGIRLPEDRERLLQGVLEVYIKSKNAKDFRQMLNKLLYHPPHIVIEEEKVEKNGELYLNHIYEGRTLVTEYIPNVLIGLEYLWGKPVHLETTEYVEEGYRSPFLNWQAEESKVRMERVIYNCKDRQVERVVLS